MINFVVYNDIVLQWYSVVKDTICLTTWDVDYNM